MFVWERDGEGDRWPTLVKWAVVGLAVVGVAGVLVWRGLF